MSNKVEEIWITGAGTGIGRALAIGYARRGHHVWVSGRRLEPLEQLADETKDLDGSIYPVVLDVTDAEQIEHVWTAFEQQNRRFDRVILNAGNHIEMPATAFTHETCEALMQVNFFGVTRVMERVLPEMLERNQGQIAVVASLAGYRGLPVAAAYGASKAALIAMMESLRAETANTGVDLRIINPGFVKTPLTDKNEFEMPFLIAPEEAALSIIKGLKGSSFEIRFPSVFAWILQFLSMLPYRLYFPLVQRATKQ